MPDASSASTNSGPLQQAGQALVDPASLGTFAILATVTVAIVNGIKMATNVSPRWLGLVVAQILCLLVASQSKPTGSAVMHYLVAICNGFLVYVSAFGTANVAADTAQKVGGPGGGVAPGAIGALDTRRPFFERW